MDDDAPRIPGRNRPLYTTIAVAVVLGLFIFWPEPVPDFVECGDAAGDHPPWRHNTHCKLRGTVESPIVVSMGDLKPGEGIQRVVGVRWFAKLHGANVVVAFPADRPEVFKWHAAHLETLLGYPVDTVGRMFDADQEKGYSGMGTALRKKLGIPAGAQLWVFDIGDVPAGG